MSFPILSRVVNLAAKRKTVTVELPELGVSVILKELSAGQIRSIEKDIVQQLAMSIVDEAGERIYVSEDDIRALAEMPIHSANILAEHFMELNGVGQDAADAALKNSKGSRNTGSVIN